MNVGMIVQASSLAKAVGELGVDVRTFSEVIDIEVKNNSAVLEHEASTSKINQEQIFYLLSRGLDMEGAVSLIINGFCKEVFKELPMEFAVEAVKLLEMKLEGSVG